MLINGDSKEELKKLSTNSIDSLVCDPPAGISFMGKDWDDYGSLDNFQNEMKEIFQEVYRVLKPGAHGLVWSIPRTSHYTTMALEKCGFEIRDVITHLFGSGFPKSLDVSKAIDKKFGGERTDFFIREDFAKRSNKKETRDSQCISGEKGVYSKPSTPEAQQWSGFGTALKPACEFWILVSKLQITPKEDINHLTKMLGGLLCLSLNAKLVEQILISNHHDLKEVFNFVLNHANNNPTKLREELSGKMDIFRSPEMAKTCLSIVWLWSYILAVLYQVENKSITSMRTRLTTELKTLNLSVQEITSVLFTHANQPEELLSNAQIVEKITKEKYLQFNMEIISAPESVLMNFTENVLKKIVAFAVNNLGKLTHDIDIVQLNVGESQEGLRQEEEKFSLANIAINNLKQFNQEIQNFVDENAWPVPTNKELIILIRKPLSEKTVCDNVLKWGTGALNIDGSRIHSSQPPKPCTNQNIKNNSFNSNNSERDRDTFYNPNAQGRFPANFLLSHSEDCTDESCGDGCAVKMLNEQSGVSKSTNNQRNNSPSKNLAMSGDNLGHISFGHSDQGGASRFFYCAKVSTRERNEGLKDLKNTHPTLKSIKLMSYLVKLITPPGGTVLDCFMGSGSTGCACAQLGFNFIGIEREKEYFEIAEKRIAFHSNKLNEVENA